jgi:hypothetical protein
MKIVEVVGRVRKTVCKLGKSTPSVKILTLTKTLVLLQQIAGLWSTVTAAGKPVA